MTTNIVKHKRSLCGRIRRVSLQMIAACSILAGTAGLQSCEKDILEGQPEWLGNSIYERLQEGITTSDGSKKSFNYTLRLIDDLGYTTVLSQTGSRTLFASGDDAFEAWFAAKGKSYEQLSLSEKKQLLNNAMIDNAYLIELMSNVTGTPPLTGSAMRRPTTASFLDSISYVTKAEMPAQLTNSESPESMDAWGWQRHKEGIHMVKDDTNPPMIHFLPAFMKNNEMTDNDLKIISNGQSNSINDSWVNGMKVISTEQTCKNGYIYVIDGVMDYKSNMAQVLHDQPDTKLWAQAIDRFSVPQRVSDATLQKYWDATGNTDTLYSMRYLNNTENRGMNYGGSLYNPVNNSGLLLFDPGWNNYSNYNISDGLTMYKDAAVMIVPADDVVMEWFNNGEGSDIKKRFDTWQNISHEMMASIINVNMQKSFVSSIPSKFDLMLDNSSQDKLGIEPSHVRRCIMCNNGVIYVVGKFFTPDSYSSVLYPMILQSEGVYSAIAHAIQGSYGPGSYISSSDFSPYISSLHAKFSVFVPYNTTESSLEDVQKTGKMFRMIDPCSYGYINNDGEEEVRIIEVSFSNGTVNGFFSKAKVVNGQIELNTTDKPTKLKTTVVENRLYDLIDNSIILNTLDEAAPGQKYFLSKAGSVIEAEKVGSNVRVRGGYQIENDEDIFVNGNDIAPKNNGVTYGLCAQSALSPTNPIGVLQTARNTSWKILKDQSDNESQDYSSLDENGCYLFYFLLDRCSSLLKQTDGDYKCALNQKNISLFDSDNYTVYVPQNKYIKAMMDNGWLPTPDEYQTIQSIINDPAASDDDKAAAEADYEKMKKVVDNFLRAHIQSNSVMVNGPVVNGVTYEISKFNNVDNRWYNVVVTAKDGQITLKDHAGDVLHVTGMKNKFAREYWITGNPGTSEAMISTSSNAVLHQIDGVIYYDKKSQQQAWKYASPAKRGSSFRK